MYAEIGVLKLGFFVRHILLAISKLQFEMIQPDILVVSEDSSRNDRRCEFSFHQQCEDGYSGSSFHFLNYQHDNSRANVLALVFIFPHVYLHFTNIKLYKKFTLNIYVILSSWQLPVAILRTFDVTIKDKIMKHDPLTFFSCKIREK